MTSVSRRELLRWLSLSAVSAGALLTGCQSIAKTAPRVLIVGGGFAGLSCARTLKRLRPNWNISLIEPKANYVACPFSNLVIGQTRDLSSQTFDYGESIKQGIRIIQAKVRDIDPVSHSITLNTGNKLEYDRLVLAPGISLNYAALPGYDEDVAQLIPHAWQAGPQTMILAKQLQAMKNGGLVVISVPENPYRCPPGPYERASLIAHYLKSHKPKSKLLILDSKDNFSKQPLFQQGWREHYGDLIEWQGLSDGARLVEVDAKSKTLITDFDRVTADVANVIPPQQAGTLALETGIADDTGWCPIDAASFVSTKDRDIHVIGDAAIANAMPKSAFAANAQAKLCAIQLVRGLEGDAYLDSKLMNTCYSLITPNHGISVADVYQSSKNLWLPISGAGGTSPLNATKTTRMKEAKYAAHWYQTITHEVFQ